MSTPTLRTPQEPKDQTTKRQKGLAAFRDLLEIIRDYGMPTVAFGTGIYTFIVVLRMPMAVELKTAVALVLTLVGLLAQLWIYSRENPRTQSDEVKDQLTRMTNLVEHLVTMSLEEKIKPR